MQEILPQLSQQSLFSDIEGDFEIKKHSSFIQTSSSLSLSQNKLINAIIYIVKDQLKRNPEQKIFVCNLGILKRLAGISGTDNNQLKAALRGLVTSAIEYNILWKDKEKRGMFTFVSDVEIEVETIGFSSILKIELPTRVVEAIKRPRIYANINLLVTRSLSSKHAFKLYELLMDYINLWKINISYPELRKVFWTPDKVYAWFDMWKRRVLNKSVKELNEKTDLNISYDIERIGKKVSSITLSASANGKSFALKNGLDDDGLLQKLIAYEFSENKAKKILAQHDREYIWANIEVVEEKIKSGYKVRSVKAVLMDAFNTDYRTMENEYTKIQKEQLQEKENEKMALEKEQSAIVELENEYKQKRKEAVAKLKTELDENELQELQHQFVEETLQNELLAKTYHAKGFQHPIIQSRWNNFLIKRFLASELHDFDNYKSLRSKMEKIAN